MEETQELPEDVIRDIFAALAISGAMRNQSFWTNAQEVAVLAYDVADAMLVERQKRLTSKPTENDN